MVEGTVEAIVKAYKNRQAGTLQFSQGAITNAQFNRSLDAYNKNPETEQRRYKLNTDPDMTLIKALDQKGQPIASLNWFAVHPVSLPMASSLISGDNKGLASYFHEKSMGTSYRKDGEFISGFFQANSGDISPYPISIEDYEEQDYWSYLRQSAKKQFEEANTLFQGSNTPLENKIEARGFFKDMNNFAIASNQAKTCRGMLGVAFAAGTENGAPVPIFKEGTRYGLEWPEITLMPGEQNCQQEKVILLPTGAINPSWTAHILYFQLIQIGELAIVGAPFEITTMAGRRLKETIGQALASSGVNHVVLTALANDYAHYVTTPEEYQAQNYEGGSNLFGPNSLIAYQQIYQELADAIVQKKPTKSLTSPPDQSDSQFKVQPGVVLDTAPLGKKFGDVAVSPKSQYETGKQVEVEFWGAHPKNDLKRNESYFTIQKKTKNGFESIAFDWDDHTWMTWHRNGISRSRIKVGWTPESTEKGEFRICHQGASRSLIGKVSPYQGCTNTFNVH